VTRVPPAPLAQALPVPQALLALLAHTVPPELSAPLVPLVPQDLWVLLDQVRAS
jgi:hypothetical protein